MQYKVSRIPWYLKRERSEPNSHGEHEKNPLFLRQQKSLKKYILEPVQKDKQLKVKKKLWIRFICSKTKVQINKSNTTK